MLQVISIASGNISGLPKGKTNEQRKSDPWLWNSLCANLEFSSSSCVFFRLSAIPISIHKLCKQGKMRILRNNTLVSGLFKLLTTMLYYSFHRFFFLDRLIKSIRVRVKTQHRTEKLDKNNDHEESKRMAQDVDVFVDDVCSFCCS